MKKQGTIKIGKILSYVAIVLVFVLVCGFLAYFTGGFTSDFKTFYAVVDGKDILTSANGYVIAPEKPLIVDVKYTFGAVNKNIYGYTVKVVPNTDAEQDFDFTIDGQVYSFAAEKDLTKGFDIEQGESSFTLKPKGSLTEIMAAVYPNNTVGDCSDKGFQNMCALIVTSYNGKASVKICFTIFLKPTGITFDKEVIVF